MKNRFLTIFTLGLLSAIGPFSIDMYLPGFPDIAASLNTDISQVAYSISSFFIGISIGQLFYGPLLDRFGRKLPLTIGLFIYLGTSLYLSLVTNIESLIAARFFQALGSCAGMVSARALVRDIFPVEENAKIFSFLMIVIAVSPLIAPTTGGYITAVFGWHAIFIALALISVFILLAVYFWLPSGMPPDKSLSLKPKPIIKGYLKVAKVPQFLTYTLAGSLAASGLYAYIAGSPKVFMEIYQVTEKQYGWIFAIISLGMVTAGQVNNLLLKRYTSEAITRAALSVQVVTGLILVVSSYYGWLSLYSIIALICFYLGTQGFVFPNTSALSLAPFSRNAGTASALMGAVQLGIGAVITAGVSSIGGTTAMPMVGVMSFCAVSAFLILTAGTHFIGKRTGAAEPAPVVARSYNHRSRRA